MVERDNVISLLADRRPPSPRKGEWALASVRPVTLLIACGIVLVTGLLIVTLLTVGSLHDSALAGTRRELARIDGILAEAASRPLNSADGVLRALAKRLGPNRDGLAAPEVARALADGIGPGSPLATIALVGADGEFVNSVGWWPPNAANTAERDFYKALHADPGLDRAIGAPIEDLRTGAKLIPLVRRIADASGATLGYIVGAIPVAEFESLFGAVQFGIDGSVALQRVDGTTLAQYPMHSRTAGPRLQAAAALPGYPLSILVARSQAAALDDWAHQASMFGLFALAGACGIGTMLYLIARQLRIHAALAAVRAEKLDMEHARVVAEAELLKKDRLSVLGQLTATVAHELRNPLSAIRNTLFSLKEMAAGGGLKLDRPIARMERSIERCNRIIGDLLEYARTRELRRTAIGFDAWLREIVAEQSLPATVTLVEELGAGDALALIDGERVRRVVVNLLENAVQALAEMPADGGERRIAVRTRVVDGNIEFALEDTGPGIAPENLERIFEPLFSTKSFGTGLGLATVRQIVGQHGGTIDVASEPGRGTCFTVRLPLGEAVKEAA